MSTNPFSRQENTNYFSESSKCEIKQAPVEPKSKVRSKSKNKNTSINKTSILDYSTCSKNDKTSKRYSSRSKLSQPKSGPKNMDNNVYLNTQNSDALT